MASSALVQAQNLIFWAGKQAMAINSTPGAVLDALALAAGAGFATGGGRLISASVNGKSFAYQLDPELNVSDLMEALRQADALIATVPTATLAAQIALPRQTSARVTF